jgi:very-short-patch-repair endonuclease
MTRTFAIAVLEDIAATHHGLFTEEQAFYENVSAHMLWHHCRSGRWRRVGPRVYEVVGQEPDWRRTLMAASLSLGPRAVLSHRSAAALHGFDGVARGTVDVTVLTGRRRRGWNLHRRAPVPPEEVVVVDGLRCTAPVRTLVDLASVADDLHWERALESVLRRGVPVEAIVGRAARMRRVLASRPAGAAATGSELETRYVQLVRAGGLPEPERQVPVGRALVDLSWPDLGLFVELDGSAFHSGPSAIQYDATRQNLVVAQGWQPLRFTWDDVVRRPRATLRITHAAVRGPARR